MLLITFDWLQIVFHRSCTAFCSTGHVEVANFSHRPDNTSCILPSSPISGFDLGGSKIETHDPFNYPVRGWPFEVEGTVSPVADSPRKFSYDLYSGEDVV